jgi:hypothetical protein
MWDITTRLGCSSDLCASEEHVKRRSPKVAVPMVDARSLTTEASFNPRCSSEIAGLAAAENNSVPEGCDKSLSLFLLMKNESTRGRGLIERYIISIFESVRHTAEPDVLFLVSSLEEHEC